MTTEPARELADFVEGGHAANQAATDDFVDDLLSRFGAERVLVSFAVALGELFEREPFTINMVRGHYSVPETVDLGAVAALSKQLVAAALASAQWEVAGNESSGTEWDVLAEVVVPTVGDGINSGKGIVGPAITQLMALALTTRTLSRLLLQQLDDDEFDAILQRARQRAADSQSDDSSET